MVRPRAARRSFLALVALAALSLAAGAQGVRRNPLAPRDAGSRGPVLGPVTRFAALGDTGLGNAAQLQVAAGMGVANQRIGIHLALLLGDNFYPTGVDSVNDPQFQTKFVTPYGPLGFPFHPILGNDDYGGAVIDYGKGDYQVAYSAVDPQWVMPATHYRFSTETAFFVGLDTTRLVLGDDAQQRADVAAWMAEAGSRWKIAFGHHTYVSNGPHGNAGNYNGLTPADGLLSGIELKRFFDDLVVGQFDLYVCGHDHSRQDLGEVGGTRFVVSGAGSQTTALVGTNPVVFQAATEGFFTFEARGDELVIRAYDAGGNLEHYSRMTR